VYKTVFFEKYLDGTEEKTRMHFYEPYNKPASFSPIWFFGYYIQSYIVNDKIIVISKGNESLPGSGDAAYLYVYNMTGDLYASREIVSTGAQYLSLYVTQDNKIIVKVNDVVYVLNYRLNILLSYDSPYMNSVIVGGIGNMYLIEYNNSGNYFYYMHSISGDLLYSISNAANKIIVTPKGEPLHLWYADINLLNIGILKINSNVSGVANIDISENVNIDMDSIVSIRNGERSMLYVLGVDSGNTVINIYDKLSILYDTIDVDSLPVINVYGFELDDLGGVWIYGDNGAYRYKKQGPMYVLSNGELSATPGGLTIFLVGGFEPPTQSSSFTYLSSNLYVDKLAFSNDNLFFIGKGHDTKKVAQFSGDIIAIARSKEHIFVAYEADFTDSSASVPETPLAVSTLPVTIE